MEKPTRPVVYSGDEAIMEQRKFSWWRILEIFVGVFTAVTLWSLLGLMGAT